MHALPFGHKGPYREENISLPGKIDEIAIQPL